MSRRALSPVVGIVVMLAVSLLLAAVGGASLLEVAAPEEPASPVSLSLEVDAETNRLSLTHEGGPTLDVREIDLRVTIDGRPLFHQPPVPFAGARGFAGAPTGPFNSVTDPEWSAGESTSLRLANTNVPRLEPGSSVEIAVFEGDHQIVAVTATAS